MPYKKKIIQVEIFRKSYDGERFWIPFGDFPKDLLPTDKVMIDQDPGYYSENNSWDPSTTLKIWRDREETDEELEERKQFWTKKAEEGKKQRYEEYLKLKKEFENETEKNPN